jgi:hypothetical protein
MKLGCFRTTSWPSALFGHARALAWMASCAWAGAYAGSPDPALAKTLRTHASTQSNIDMDDQVLRNQRFSIRQEAISLLYKKRYGLSFYADTTIRFDTMEEFDSGENYDFRIETLYAEWQKGLFRTTLGMQTFTWGETFGVPITDVINPIDYTQPFSSEVGAAKMSIAAASVEMIAGGFYLQALGTPFPRRSPLPKQVEDIEVIDPEEHDWGQTFEYGGRAGYLFGMGLDLKVFYYSHFSRTPRFELRVPSPTSRPLLVPIEAEVETIGLSASQAFESVVFRFDGVYENGYLLPLSLAGVPFEEALSLRVGATERTQATVGIDYTTEKRHLFGLQYQADHLMHQDAVPLFRTQTLHWGGAQMNLNFFSEQLTAGVFALAGLGNGDLWVRPKVTIFATNRIKIETEANFLSSDGDGNTDLYSNRKNLIIGAGYRF